ncbi:hypothetical protein ACFL6Q_02495 [Candidatus Neomarinimicrobiota bacterium]
MVNLTQRELRPRRSLGILQLFIALGAIGGGYGLITAPDGSNLGMPLTMLETTPFHDFLIPGWLLLAVVGLGSLAAGILTLRRQRLYPELAVVMGCILMGWIIIQVALIRGIHWLHPTYFILGALEAWLGWQLRKSKTAELQDREATIK